MPHLLARDETCGVFAETVRTVARAMEALTERASARIFLAHGFRLLYADPHLCEMTGYSRQALLGTDPARAPPWEPLMMLLLIGAGTGVCTWVARLSRTDGYYQFQGRYVFPVIVPWAYLLAGGWTCLTGRRPAAVPHFWAALTFLDAWARPCASCRTAMGCERANVAAHHGSHRTRPHFSLRGTQSIMKETSYGGKA